VSTARDDPVILDGGYRRPAVLRGRVAVFAVGVFLTMRACRQLASFLVGQALLGDQLNASLSDAACT
jgi:hypothetical protein